MKYIDSHAHLGEFKKEINEMFELCVQNNVGAVLNICLSKEDYDFGCSLLNRSDVTVALSYGIHPEDANEYLESDIDFVEQVIKEKKIVAIGEIGLDYYWVQDNKEKQKELFISQIKLANKYDLPLIIHERDAMEDTYNILEEYDVNKSGVIHCFSGSVEMAKRFSKLGYYISLGGPITFKNARHSVDVVREIDLKFLLSETDSPFLTPVPFRGKKNSPAYVKYVVEKMSEIKNVSCEEVSNIIKKNYMELFNVEV